MTCDRDLDLEYTLDARSSVDHRVQVWSQSSHLCRSRSDLRKKFTDGLTDGRTDRQTDDGRRAIVLAHCVRVYSPGAGTIRGPGSGSLTVYVITQCYIA